jgi:hypothetical protein
MKKILVLFIIILTSSSFAQDNIYIYFDSDSGQIENFYIHNNVGIFKLSQSAELESIILGKFKPLQILTAINDYENNRMKKVFSLAGIEMAIYSLREINYPDKYSYLPDFVKDLPNNINGIKIEYYADYYDDETVKGKIKSVGSVKLDYYKDYFLPDAIKGKVRRIAKIKFSLLNEYFRPEVIGKVAQVGAIKIKYYHSYLHEELNGKITQLGNYKIIYFEDEFDNNHYGQFNKMIGNDNRFILLQ